MTFRALATSLMFFLGATVAAGASAGTFTFRLTGEPETLDWNKAHTTVENYLMINLMEGLVGLDGKMKVVPALAKSWAISPDGKTYTFKLREGVKWSDGVPLKAKDFVFSWRRVLSPLTAASYAYFLYDVEGAEDFNKGKVTDFAKVGIKAPDDSTVIVKLTKPVAYWLNIPTFWVTFPLREDVVEKFGNGWASPGRMVTVGAYNLSAYDLDSKVVLKANPSYYGSRGNVDTAVGLIVKDDTTALTLYESGKLDFLTEISTLDLKRLEKRPDLKSFPYLKTGYLGFVTTKFPTSNAKFRRAIAMAIDKGKLVSLFPGLEKATSFVPPALLSHSKTSGLAFDSAKAKLELKASGVDMTKPVQLELLLPNWDRPLLIAQFVQDQLKKNLGLETSLQPFDHKTYRSQMDLYAFSLFEGTWGADYPDADNFYSVFLGDAGNNKTKWKNAEYDRQVLAARSTMDVASRLRSYRAAEKLLLEDEAAIVPLYYQPNTALLRARVHGLELDPLNYMYFRKVNVDGN